MRKLLLLLMAVVCLSIVGCGSPRIVVSQLSAELAIQHVCIEENQKVKISEFLPVVEDGFARHGISPELYLGDMPDNCDAIVKYSALQTFGFKTYLGAARIYMLKDDKKVSEIIYYYQKDNFSQFESVKEKIDPLMDKMLVEYPLRP